MLKLSPYRLHLLIVNALLASGPSAGFALTDERENSGNLPNRTFDTGQLMS
jgi:hypothetical protein